ncbi:Gfo/Idh/MocA family protein [Microbacterium sp. GXF0217]
MATELRVAMIGHGFMGAAHSVGWRQAPAAFELPLAPRMTVLVGRDAGTTAASARRWGWAESSTNWRAIIDRDDIDVVDIVTPGDTHAEIALAALAAGKHVLCEKPLANSVREAEAMRQAAQDAAAHGIRAMVGFTYRRVPAVTLMRDMIAAGRIGTMRQVRASYRQDWLADPESPMTWRLDKDRAGSGALGDIGAHIVDMAQFVTGQTLTEVSAALQTIVTERPVLAESIGLGGTAGAERGTVTVDDLALFHGRFDSGVLASFEATRFATGRKNALDIEISGDAGALHWSLEDLNALEFYDATRPPLEQGFTRILVTEPEHPYLEGWWPAGHMLGYEHGFSHQAKDFIEAVAYGHDPRPTFTEGLHVQRVLDAVERSASAGAGWTEV